MGESITTQNKYYSRFTEQWDKVRHCLEGEDEIKAQGVSYLPQPSGMTPPAYDAYRTRASFYSVAERTLRGMTGMVFRNDPVMKLPEPLDPWLESATNENMSLQMFIEEVTRNVLSLGRYGVLLDFPNADVKVGTIPHLVTYDVQNILDWKEELIDGKQTLTKVVLQETMEEDSLTGTGVWLKLQLVEGVYTVENWTETLDSDQGPVSVQVGEALTPTINGAPLDYIPFMFFNPYDHRPQPSKPPFIDLCNMNLAHYRNSADYEHALYLTAQPTPWVAGQLDSKTKPSAIGAGTIWYLPQDSKAGMLEFSGKGIEAQRLAMQDKEDRMASLGARMIKDSSRVQEKAETARLRARGETSLVMDALQTVESGVARLVTWAAEWLGIQNSEVVIKLNKDFVDAKMDANMLMAVVKAWQTGAVSRDTMHSNLQQGEVMDMSRDAATEKDLIEDEGEFVPQADSDTGLGSESVDIVPEVET